LKNTDEKDVTIENKTTGRMKSFTVMLDESDIDHLKTFASRINIPPHVLARSILLRGLEVEIDKWNLEGRQ